MRTYERYQDSGIIWIGEIPEHWEVKKIKHTTYLKARVGWKGLRSDEFLDEGFAYLLTGTDIKNGIVDWQNSYFIDKVRYDDDPFIQLQEDDLLITKDGTIGKIAIVDKLEKPTCLNSGVFVLRTTGSSWQTKYLFNILASNIFKSFIDFTSYGSTILHLYQNVFNEFQFPLPSLEEQSAIVNYLDSKTTEIDQTIADKEALINLYEEEKKALINEVVTKGLNPNAKFKPSGIDWLGEIPEHWEVKKLFYLFDKISSGTTPKSDDQSYYLDGHINWLNTGDLNNSIIKETSKKITQKAFDEHSTLKGYPIGSIVIAMYGATIGKLGILEIETTTNQACCVLSNIKNSETMFVFNCLLSGQEALINMSFGGGQPNISQDTIRSFKISIPPVKEQITIVQHIEKEAAKINEIITLTKKEIELLKEYRQALIFEAVTGKIKVSD